MRGEGNDRHRRCHHRQVRTVLWLATGGCYLRSRCPCQQRRLFVLIDLTGQFAEHRRPPPQGYRQEYY